MILFCATEAGGAQELVPVLQLAKQNGIRFVVLSSSVTSPVFLRSAILCEEQMILSQEEAIVFLATHGITSVVAGTTGTIKSERHLIAAAKKMGIPSVVVLDDWYNYRLRFVDEQGGLGTYIPSIICVQDALSQTLAIEEGLPQEVLQITGSSSLSAVATKADVYRTAPPPVPEALTQHRDAVCVLFLSERIRETYGAMPGSSGSHGSFLGFHEDMVREDLVRILSKQSNVVVVEKLHPSEQTKHPPKGMEACWHTVEGKEPVDPLLWYADVIVGMCSKTLLEAAMFGRRPISYQPNATNTNKCTAARLGVAELVTQFDALQARLPLLLQKRQPDSVQTPPFPFATSEAPAKILQLATL